MNHSIQFIKTQPLFWPVLLSLLAHGVFMLCWQPRSEIALTPPQPVQVEFRSAGTPQGNDRPTGGSQSTVTQSKDKPAPVRQPVVAERKVVSPQTEAKTVTTKPVLTRPENTVTADNRPSVNARPAVSGNITGAAVSGGAATQGKGDAAAGSATATTGNGAGSGKGEGDGQGRGPKGDAPPGRMYAPTPKYPETSIEMGEVGSVRLSLTITRDGNARNVRVAGSSGFPRLDRQARNTVEDWRFKPAMKNGEPVEIPYAVTVRFNLNGSVSTSGG